jgi:hypothetical protein
MWDLIVQALERLLSRLSTNNGVDIDLSTTDYTNNDGFFLYVGVTGIVAGKDFAGNDFQRTFVVGYHPVKMKIIKKTNTTATSLAACYK